MNARLSTRPAAANQPPARALPKGTRLNDRFEIIGVINDGSFGIVYLAQDLAHPQHVVIKEYLPSMLAWRTAGSGDVAVKAPRHEEAFNAGLRSFLHEARLLTSFEHPTMVGVDRFWKERGTAFMAMPLVEGPTLRALISSRGAAPDEAELRRWLRPLLDALAALHGANCVHGDITPDSILIGPDGPRLLGFGGGRHAIGAVLRSPADVLKPGYAPIEQYAPEPAPALGPPTDLYALASVVYAVLTGRAPMAATERRAADRLVPLHDLVGERFSDSLITAVDAALAVQPAGRVTDVAAFRALLNGQGGAPAPRPRAAPPAGARPGHLNALLYAATAVCVLAVGALGYLMKR
ncbi:MAG: serine/threonine-protein kinase [Burkholderiales bacterium]